MNNLKELIGLDADARLPRPFVVGYLETMGSKAISPTNASHLEVILSDLLELVTNPTDEDMKPLPAKEEYSLVELGWHNAGRAVCFLASENYPKHPISV